jgi:hypothetical protein
VINPADLSPEELYRLQSETWAQGAEAENKRIIELFESACRCGGKQTAGYYCEADWAIFVINYKKTGKPRNRNTEKSARTN